MKSIASLFKCLYTLAAILTFSIAQLSIPAFGQLTVETDTIQDGGILIIDPEGDLEISHHTNNPLLTLMGYASTTGVKDVYVGRGYGYQGQLLIADSSVLTSQRGYVGFISNSHGIATVSGTGSVWHNSDWLDVGSQGSEGVLNIIDGGRVVSRTGSVGVHSGGTGTVTVNGTGSHWMISSSSSRLTIGQQGGEGTLNIEEGGVVTSPGGMLGISSSSSIGRARVSGIGSQWILSGVGYLEIGQEGQGYLNIEDGGTVVSNRGLIGGSYGASGGAGAVTVSGNGSKWESKSDMLVGYDGNGTLNIEDGGLVTSLWGTIASEFGSRGDVLVTGAGSQWNTSWYSLDVGRRGHGTLTITDGGLVRSGRVSLGGNSAATGEIEVSGIGSHLDVSYEGASERGPFHVGRDGHGILKITDGGLVTSGLAQLGFTGGTGTAIVTGHGSRWINDETLHVGYAYGALERGTGTLTVADGGEVVAHTLFASSSDLQGNGIISTKGVVLGGYDLVFDATHGLQQTLTFGNGGQLHFNLDGSGLLGVGYQNNAGSLLISDGVVVTSRGGGVGYRYDQASSIATVSGPGSLWECIDAMNIYGAMSVSNNSLLNVLNGGQVKATTSFVNEGGSAVVAGVDSKWSTTGSFFVDGSLTVRDGGEAAMQTIRGSINNLHGNGDIYSKGSVLGGIDLVFDANHGLQQVIPFGDGGKLHLDFDGTGALGVGVGENGSLTIKDGIVINATSFVLGDSVGSVGIAAVTGPGSKLNITGGMFIGGDNYFGTGGVGQLTIQNGAEVQASSTIYVEENGLIDGDGGMLSGNVVNRGTIAPGNSPGLLTIDGDLDDTGTLQFEIASLSSFDQLNISGLFSAGGTIEVSLLGGYTPNVGDSFTLVNFGDILDNGYTFDFSKAGSALWWDTSSFALNGSISVVAIPEPSSILLTGIAGAALLVMKAQRKGLRRKGKYLSIIGRFSLQQPKH